MTLQRHKILGFAFLVLGMLVYDDTLFGPTFRREIMPRMTHANPCTLCCMFFCGVDLEISDKSRLWNQQED
uniref:Uncharacterized protein n=1 Tax=Acrobeloides nanus TaxID=290746 RepID=A0A914EPM7_9BILA